MSITVNCDACGTTREVPANYLSSCSVVRSAIEPGWTHSVDENYCSNCAAVRAQTWLENPREGLHEHH